MQLDVDLVLVVLLGFGVFRLGKQAIGQQVFALEAPCGFHHPRIADRSCQALRAASVAPA